MFPTTVDENVPVRYDDPEMNLVPEDTGKGDMFGVDTNDNTNIDSTSDTINVKTNDTVTDTVTVPREDDTQGGETVVQEKKKKSNLWAYIAVGVGAWFLLGRK